MFTKNNANQALVDAVNKVLEESEKKLLLEPEDEKKEKKEVKEALKGGQVKLDKNHNGKIDGHDFKLLRKEGIIDTIKAGAKKVMDKVAPGDDELLKRLEKETGGKRPNMYNKPKNEEVVDEAAESPFTSWKKPKEAQPNGGSGIKQGSRYGGSKQKEEPKEKELKERSLTPGEEKTKEHNVKSMKKGMAGFKARYGDRAKSVMYATATKQAKNEEVEELDELSKSTLGSYAKKASRDAVITRKIGADFENQANKARNPGMKAASNEISQKYKVKSWKRRDGVDKAVDRLAKEEVEMNEAINDNMHPAGVALLKHIKPEHHNLYKPHLTTDVFNGSFRDRHDVLTAAKQAGHLNEDIGGISTISEKKKKEMEEAADINSKTTDTLAGRKKVPASYQNQHTDYKVKLNAEEKEEGHEDEKEDKAMMAKMLKKSPIVKSLDKNGDGKHTMADHQKEAVSEGKGTDFNPTFSTDANTTSSPMKLAKELAHKSFKKIRTEVMGKTGTSEEKSKW